MQSPLIASPVRVTSAQAEHLSLQSPYTSALRAELLLETPWFPTSREELDLVAGHVIMYGPGLDADHPVGGRRLPAREQLF